MGPVNQKIGYSKKKGTMVEVYLELLEKAPRKYCTEGGRVNPLAKMKKNKKPREKTSQSTQGTD